MRKTPGKQQPTVPEKTDSLPAYTVIRSRRKTLALCVKKDATLEARAPIGYSEVAIRAFVLQKQAWISAAVERRRKILRAQEGCALSEMSLLTLRGKQYPLIFGDGLKTGFSGSVFYAPAGLTGDPLRAQLIEVYRTLAQAYITGRTVELAKTMRAQPVSVQIGSAKFQWGSCTAKGALRFSWRLILLGDALIDYVIVHELAHLTQLNHSLRFWEIVQRTVPDYPVKRAELRQAARALEGAGWL